mmetsp:Transcript_5285/g.6430  ORF Transcript_5285/g.6430 Transcript_5285/m.6430 type:complete len:89 (-) Transcript_5285:417-683(-)
MCTTVASCLVIRNVRTKKKIGLDVLFYTRINQQRQKQAICTISAQICPDRACKDNCDNGIDLLFYNAGGTNREHANLAFAASNPPFVI